MATSLVQPIVSSSLVPPAREGLQVNFCRTPRCQHFGVPPAGRAHRGPGSAQKNAYSRHGTGRAAPGLLCHACQQITPIKSNAGIAEELARMEAYLSVSDGPGCSNPGCSNHGHVVHRHPDRYQRHGRTKAGNPRYECKACSRTFADSPRVRRRRQPGRDASVFRALINKVPLRRIMRMTRLRAGTLYDTIDFIHRKCLAFAAERERGLANRDFASLYRRGNPGVGRDCAEAEAEQAEKQARGRDFRVSSQTGCKAFLGLPPLAPFMRAAARFLLVEVLPPRLAKNRDRNAGGIRSASRSSTPIWMSQESISMPVPPGDTAISCKRVAGSDSNSEIQRRGKINPNPPSNNSSM